MFQIPWLVLPARPNSNGRLQNLISYKMLYEIKFFVHDFKTWFGMRIPMKDHSFEDKVLPMMHMRQVLSVVQKEGGALVQTCLMRERQR
jgi:hypothetical protein